MRSHSRHGKARRRLLTGAAAAALATFACRAAVVSRADKVVLNIAAGSALITLAEFVRQTGLQVLFEPDAIRDHSTRAINGPLDAAEALGLMLDGSGLVYEFVNERTVTVRPRPGAARPAGKGADAPPVPAGLQSL